VDLKVSVNLACLFLSWGSSGWGIGGLWVVWLWVVGISVDQLDADLLGQGQLNLLASRGIQLSHALLDGLDGILNLGHGDALVLCEVGAADTGKGNGLVDAGLDWLGVGDSHININGGDDGHIVLGSLGDLVAVVVSVAAMSITVMAISSGWLADSDHLNILLLLEGDLNSLGSGGLLLLLVAVGANLIGDLFNGLSADSPGDIIAELLVDDLLDGKVNIGADLLEGWHADLGNLSHILDGAVVLGLLIAVAAIGWGVVAIGWGGMVAISWGGMVAISWGGMSVGWGWVAVSWGWVVSVAGSSRGKWQQSQDSSKGLHCELKFCWGVSGSIR